MAIEDCTKALQLNAAYEKALLRRAQLFELEEETLEKALEDYQALMKLNPACRDAVASSQVSFACYVESASKQRLPSRALRGGFRSGMSA